MRVIMIGLILVAVVAGLVFSMPGARAAKDLPDPIEFGFGARLDMNGQHIQASINAAAGLGLDWIAADFDWAARMPDPNLYPDLTSLKSVMKSAEKNNLQVMISLTHAPDWALTPQGPDPNLSASLAISLARQYQGTLGAIELFPSVNTTKSWGAAPDPAAYSHLFQAVDAALKAEGLNVLLVTSFAPAYKPGDTDERAYLEMLYQFGAADWLQVVGVRLPGLAGDPLTMPDEASGIQDAGTVLRHYEILRQVMVDYNHTSGQMWITGFSWPSELPSASPDEQSKWMVKAFQVLRSQLYIKIAFFQQLNPPISGVDPETGAYTSLVLPDVNLHPACERLIQLTSLDENEQNVYFISPISKRTNLKSNIKP